MFLEVYEIYLNYNWVYLSKDLVTQNISIQKRKNAQDFTLAIDKKPKVEQQGGDADGSLFWEMTYFDNIEEREESVFYGLSWRWKIFSQFAIKEKKKFDHQHDLVYHAISADREENYIEEVGRRLGDRICDHSGKASHVKIFIWKGT